MSFEKELNQITQAFQARIGELARRAVLETLGAAFDRNGRNARLALPPGRGTRGTRKRTASELDELGERFSAFVRQNPGKRIEQINKQLGARTVDLALPIRKLIAAGVIRTKFKKRSTQYFPGARGMAEN
jgi:hypothetical protein